MKNLMTLASLTLLLTACGGGSGGDSSASTLTGNSNVAALSSEAPAETGAQNQNPEPSAPLENTAALKSSADFNFETSRAIAIDFNVAAASNSPGLMSLCTKYTKSNDNYDVDYSSCTVQAPLVNGSYNGKMDVTNDVSSVIGVVWFKDEAIPPVYKEFSLGVGAKLARRGGGLQAIVWR